ncbi:DUF2523 family protein [Rheinheimera sp.]|uniref:DUF2523 family protein n=1 Tax=Rheinheimera sp. TaxID=1869214 RepID=UPI003D295FCE
MKQWFVNLWNDYLDWCLEVLKEALLLIKDMSLDLFELMVTGVVFAIGLITPPEFLANGVNTLVSAIPSSVIYFLGQSGLSEGLAIYGSGIMFRLARKIYTLGQW